MAAAPNPPPPPPGAFAALAVAAAVACANFWRRAGLVGQACLRKEGLALIALLVSLGGATVLSFFIYGNLLYFRAQKATEQLFYLSAAMLAIIAITFWSSHRLLGSKQAIKAELWDMKLEMNQGDDGAPSPPAA